MASANTLALKQLFVPKVNLAQRGPLPLVPLKQIPRVHLVRHVRELVAPAVGHDHVAAGLEGLQVVGHLGAEELRRVQRGLVDHHGHALGLHALHDALDGARAEVVGVGLHRQAVNAHDRLLLALVDAVPHHLQHPSATKSLRVRLGCFKNETCRSS